MMAARLQELDQFTNFARHQLVADGPDLSLEECVRLWRHEQERQESVRGILQSENEDEAGLCQPIAEAFDAVRRQLGIVT